MMRSLLIVTAIAFMFAGNTVALDPKPHPLFGNKILGQSAEIAAVWKGGAGGAACGMGLYDLISGSVVPWGNYAFGDTLSPYQQQDIVAGDFDGDGDDEIVVAYNVQALPDVNMLGCVMIDVADGDLYCNNVDTIWTCCVEDYWTTKWETSYLRLFTGNFDNDSTVELGIIYCNTSVSPSGIFIKVMDWQEGVGFVPVADIEVDALDVYLGEQLVFDAASGDFDGDGIDEIVAAGGKKHTSTRYIVYLKSYRVLLDESRLELTDVDTAFNYIGYFNWAGEGRWVDRIALATGDMSGNTLDEIALAFEHAGAWWIPGVVSNYHIESIGHLRTYKMSADLDTILAKDSDEINFGNEVMEYCDWANYWHPYISGRAMGLAVGDLNLDGKEDLIWVAKNAARVYRTSAQLELFHDTDIPYDNRHNEQSWKVVQIADLDANPSDSIWRPEVIVGDWIGGSELYRIRALNMVHDSNGVFTGTSNVREAIETFTTNYVSLVTGDFNGSSIRLGEPDDQIIEGVSQPLVIMKAPPIHYDIINDTTYNVNGCYTDPRCNFYAEYSQSDGSVKLSTTTLRRDWGVGANISGEYTAMGIGVKTQMAMKYGEEFSKDESVSETFDVATKISLWYDDMISARTYNYRLWEYPIYSDNDLQEERILVVVPYLTQAVDQWIYSKSEDADFYTPNHEVGNIMSYYDYGVLDDNPDMDKKIFAETGIPVGTGGTAEWEILYGKFTSEGENQSRQAEIEIGASISAYGLEVGVKGNYGQARFTTQSTSVSQDVALNVFLDMISLNSQAYQVTPYAYWATNGALVLDYAVTPEGGSSFWTEHYGQTCDPAFIFPWRYDYEKGFGDPEEQKHETRDIRFMPSHPEPGDTIDVRARVYNFSLVETPSVIIVRFYVGDPDAGGQIISDVNGYTEFYTAGRIEARSYREIDLEWEIPADIPYEPDIYAVIDPHNLVGEIHETNNKGYKTLPVDGVVTAVDEDSRPVIPETYALSVNYPNPFNPATNIEYSIPSRSHVTIEVFNILGQEVRTLVDETRPAGEHRITWDGTDRNGTQVATGVYLYRIEADSYIETRKMLFLK